MCIEVTQRPVCGACGRTAAKIYGPILRCPNAENSHETFDCVHPDEDCKYVEVPWTNDCAHAPPFGNWVPNTMEQTYCIASIMQRYLGPEEFRRQTEEWARDWGEDWIEQAEDLVVQERDLDQPRAPVEYAREFDGGHGNQPRGSRYAGLSGLGGGEFGELNAVDSGYDLPPTRIGFEGYEGLGAGEPAGPSGSNRSHEYQPSEMEFAGPGGRGYICRHGYYVDSNHPHHPYGRPGPFGGASHRGDRPQVIEFEEFPPRSRACVCGHHVHRNHAYHRRSAAGHSRHDREERDARTRAWVRRRR